ncbi:MAG: CorA family divalent cation transporter [Alphaproteobacteria bacterium]
MLSYIKENCNIRQIDITIDEILSSKAIWLDLVDMLPEEEVRIEKILGIDVPNAEETLNISISQRLYEENNAIYLTITLYINKTDDIYNLLPHTFTFIITKERLITVRDSDSEISLKYFTDHQNYIEKPSLLVFITILKNIIDKLASFYEIIGHELDNKNDQLLNTNSSDINYKSMLKIITSLGNSISKTRESIGTVMRMLIFLSKSDLISHNENFINTVKIYLKDLGAISDHANFLSNKTTFLLDATLGLINIEQNNIMKIFSVTSVIFTPPMLIGCIYGMNFEFMPELKLKFGYLYALFFMLIAAYMPYRYFKKKKWL